MALAAYQAAVVRADKRRRAEEELEREIDRKIVEAPIGWSYRDIRRIRELLLRMMRRESLGLPVMTQEDRVLLRRYAAVADSGDSA